MRGAPKSHFKTTQIHEDMERVAIATTYNTEASTAPGSTTSKALHSNKPRHLLLLTQNSHYLPILRDLPTS